MRERFLQLVALDVQVVEPRAQLERKRREAADADLESVAFRLSERRRQLRELVRDDGTDHRARDLKRDVGLDANAPLVVLASDLEAREHFAARENAVFLEERDVPLVLERRERFHRVVQVGKSAALRLLRPAVRIAVAGEDDALVRLHLHPQQLLEVLVEVPLHRVELVAQRVDRLRDDGVQDHLALCAVLRGTRRAELELVAGKGERRGAVAVGRVLRERWQRIDPEAHPALPPRFICAFHLHLVLDGIEHVVQLVAQKHRDDRGRRFVRAETVVVARPRRRLAENVGMHLDRADDRKEKGDEDCVLAGIRPRRQEIASAVGDGPVAVLAAAVDALERLLVEEADEVVLLGGLTQDLHDEHVVIDGEVQVLEHRRQLELRGRDLVVARLRGDAEPPETVLDFGHELEDARLDRAEVMVFELLMLRRRGTEDGPPGLQQVGTLQVVALVDEEVLLLRAERDLDVGLRLPELLHQPLRRAGDRLNGPEERRLHVQRLAVEGAERGRHAQGRAVLVALDERRRGRVPGRVAAGLEGRAEPARGERARVRLAADQVLAGEFLDGLCGPGRLQEGVMLLGRAARERLEPVRKVRRALLERPVLHPLGDRIRNRRVKGLALPHCREQLRRDRLRKMRADRLLGEDVFAIGL